MRRTTLISELREAANMLEADAPGALTPVAEVASDGSLRWLPNATAPVGAVLFMKELE